MRWETVPLGEVVTILSGFAFDSTRFASSGGVPLVRIRDVVPGRSTTYYRGEYEEKFVVRDGDLLVGMDGEFNRGTWRGGTALLNQRVCRLTAVPGVLDERFLFHVLPTVLGAIEKATPYVTVRHLSVKVLSREGIPLPPLPEQRRIAAILDEADSLRTSSSHALAVARDAQESLARSAVADMRRSDGELVRLGDLLKLSSGKFLPKTAQHEGNVAVFGGNGQNGWHSESMFVEPQLIIGRVGALCGAVHLTSGPVWVTDNAFIASWDRSRISANHLAWQLRLANLNQFSAVSGQPSISAARIADVMIAIPDAGQQAEFAARLDALEYHAAGLVKRTETLNELFASLQHRAFRGEL
ncbi:restriction endonuclease subunit S [Microbacterium schleiferi]|uniref:restriction endonuclease subunit S n=1 Tax=Microbacterium schleiferi TaxID=69362 RepID=UPI0031201EA4